MAKISPRKLSRSGFKIFSRLVQSWREREQEITSLNTQWFIQTNLQPSNTESTFRTISQAKCLSFRYHIYRADLFHTRFSTEQNFTKFYSPSWSFFTQWASAASHRIVHRYNGRGIWVVHIFTENSSEICGESWNSPAFLMIFGIPLFVNVFFVTDVLNYISRSHQPLSIHIRNFKRWKQDMENTMRISYFICSTTTSGTVELLYNGLHGN